MTSYIRRNLDWLALGVFVAVLAWMIPYTIGHPEIRASEVIVQQVQLQSAVSAINTASAPVGAGLIPRCRESAVYMDWGTSVTAGAVIVETAISNAPAGVYSGTWAPLATVTFAGTAPNQDVVQVTGIHWAIRTRVSTAVVGGTVSTWLVCN